MSADRIKKLLDRLACPVTKSEVKIVPSIKAGSQVMAGAIESQAGLVGAIEDFKPKFTSFAPPSVSEQVELNTMPVWEVKQSAEIAPQWPTVDQHWRLLPYGEVLHLNSNAKIKIKFGAHPSSGIVRINDERIDLFHPNSLVPRIIERKGPLEICATEERGAHSKGKQVLLESIAIQTGQMRAAGYERIAINRARPFRSRPMQILKDLPETAFMLDIGGGRRMLDDDRYFNMEYDDFDEADLYGDAQALPFQDNSIDFIHSTAVFEHLPKPHVAAQEIYRVLKPGGKAYIVTAFMQPIHSAPQHFYNASVYGLENWFEMFENRSVTWGGQFSTLMMTLARAGAKGAPPEKMNALLRALENLDQHVTREGLMLIASEATIEVQK